MLFKYFQVVKRSLRLNARLKFQECKFFIYKSDRSIVAQEFVVNKT